MNVNANEKFKIKANMKINVTIRDNQAGRCSNILK